MPARLQLVPVTLRAARAFVAEHHRHLPDVVGGIVAVGVAAEDAVARSPLELAGVAILGRPVAPALADGWTIEVTRVAVREGFPNAASMLLGAARRAAEALGYCRATTYVLDDEPGTSLKAAGWLQVASVGSATWPTGGGLPQAKTRWEAQIRPLPANPAAEAERAAVLERWQAGATVRAIAAELGVSRSEVGRIVRGVERPMGTKPGRRKKQEAEHGA